MTRTHATPEGRPTSGPSASGQVADAVPDNWVDRRAPVWLRPWLRLSRADRPAGTWLLLLPCWWGLALAVAAQPQGAGWLTVWIAVGCAIGAFLMRGAGCTWNDITDRDIDARVARTRSRPIPSGQVSVRGALAWLVAQALVALLILLTFNWAAIGLGVASLALVAVYPFAKRFTWWPQVFLGLAMNWGVLLAWTAQTGSPGLAPVLLYLAGIAWTLFYDTIYAHQDAEDDALIGVKSTALLFGDRTRGWLWGFAAVAVALMAAAVVVALGDRPAALVSGLAGVVAFGGHLVWQMARLDTADTDSCMAVFRSNRDAGLLPAPFLAAALLV
ncbi:4-hydroxybenzoate octaprenyltransferase [Rhodobaculum claviforme]|uniref:4-hydroxybenzoate octaprenyltransferase n=1 Tax=Rhodobaculum claviforme TaxID=1549854 RepID=A0A934TMD6_9RHOB|nr:4-hydroxybenzoate octaprenyltransferase [Rhodobaculum claviforme]MBK5928176.1 4-hydroxybenzoate polyprenyltransferase [Rhodobaculum claviforme]